MSKDFPGIITKKSPEIDAETCEEENEGDYIKQWFSFDEWL